MKIDLLFSFCEFYFSSIFSEADHPYEPHSANYGSRSLRENQNQNPNNNGNKLAKTAEDGTGDFGLVDEDEMGEEEDYERTKYINEYYSGKKKKTNNGGRNNGGGFGAFSVGPWWLSLALTLAFTSFIGRFCSSFR